MCIYFGSNCIQPFHYYREHFGLGQQSSTSLSIPDRATPMLFCPGRFQFRLIDLSIVLLAGAILHLNLCTSLHCQKCPLTFEISEMSLVISDICSCCISLSRVASSVVSREHSNLDLSSWLCNSPTCPRRACSILHSFLQTKYRMLFSSYFKYNILLTRTPFYQTKQKDHNFLKLFSFLSLKVENLIKTVTPPQEFTILLQNCLAPFTLAKTKKKAKRTSFAVGENLNSYTDDNDIHFSDIAFTFTHFAWINPKGPLTYSVSVSIAASKGITYFYCTIQTEC